MQAQKQKSPVRIVRNRDAAKPLTLEYVLTEVVRILRDEHGDEPRAVAA
jgi:hypothetical protein